MDKTILSLLLTVLMLLLLVIHYGMKSDQLGKQIDATNKMIESMCSCRP